METELGVRESADQLPGIDLGDGNIKTSRGTIRTPKSRLKTNTNDPKVFSEDTLRVQPEDESLKNNIPVIIHSDFGDITYNCISVIKTGNYLVLEMMQDTFSPKSYKEAPNLRLPISWENNNGSYIFTGCKWIHKRTSTNFIILMEVTDYDD